MSVQGKRVLRAFRDDGTGDTVVVFTDYHEIIDKGSGRMERVEGQKSVQTADGEKCDVIAESIDELKVRTVDTNRVLICHNYERRKGTK